MKIWCDNCDKMEASVFCSADEAALCDGCDHQVHFANKLATKHSRFSLLLPNPNQSQPLCDICQERKALLFCQEDRAILCRECDIPIHEANELTKKHNRFLLTGVKLSSASSPYTKPQQSLTSYVTPTTTTTTKTETKKKPTSVSACEILSPPSTTSHLNVYENDNHTSISQYLMETLPGWCVEDLLEDDQPSSSSSDEFYKTCNDNSFPYTENQYFGSGLSFGEWVPQAIPYQGFQILHKQDNNKNVMKAKTKGSDFAVPCLKKSRHFL